MHKIKPELKLLQPGSASPAKGLVFKVSPAKGLRIQSIICAQPYHQPVATGYWQKVLLFFSRLAQSLRLMVGVRDYQAYLLHMHSHHPQQQPMTKKQFHRYCVDARYGTNAGKLGKCPC